MSMGKIKGLRWLVIALIACATVINYIDRNALAVMWPAVSKDIGADKSDYALLVTVFMIAYAVGQSVFGKLIDRIGTKMGFVLSIAIWSVSIGLHAFVRSLASLTFLRATLGVSEAGNWPGAVKANALWFPPQERAFAQGIFNSGAAIGAIIAAPAVAALYGAFGWRCARALRRPARDGDRGRRDTARTTAPATGNQARRSAGRWSASRTRHRARRLPGRR
jgi:MFS transporter, ACS family, hexuronate transporter